MIRRRRLGVPAVNQNPLPPNANPQQRILGGQSGPGGAGPGGPGGRGHGPHPGQGHRHGRGGRGNGQGNGRGNRGNGNQGNGNPQGGGSHTGTVPPAPAPTPDPQNPFEIPSFTPQKGQADPRDQTYYTNVARLLAAARQGYSTSLLQQSYADTDYGRARQNLVLQNQQDQRSLAGQALTSGLSSSGYLNRSTTEQAGQYLLRQGDLSTTKTRSDQAAEAGRAALEQGFPLDVASEYAQAAERFAELQLQNAQNAPGELTRRALRRMRHHRKGRHGR
jgi:hypothetical protein